MKNFKRNLINVVVVSSLSLCLFACSEEPKLDESLITETKVVKERNAQGYEELLVTEKGFGKTRDEAIANALKNCLAKVLGVSLDISQRHELNVNAVLTDDLFSLNGTINKVEDINVKLNGGNIKSQIKRYDVKQEIEKDEDSYEVIVSAVINHYQPPKETKRKRIAILPLRISNKDFCKEKFVENYSQSVSNYLVKTNNFAIIDRDYLNELDSELFNLVNDSNFNADDKAKLGNKVVADYIFVGSLDEFSFTNRVTKESYIDEFRDNFNGNVRISWKLLDVATGLVVDSSVNSYRYSNKDLKGTNDQCFIDKLESISKEVGMRIVDAIYPIAVVGCSGNDITIARGGDYIKPQQIFNVYRMGEEVIDPYTNESLGREESLLGKVSVTDTSTKLSHASFVDSNISITDCKGSKYILRLEKTSNQSKNVEKKSVAPKKPKF